MKNSLGNPIHVTQTVGVKNVGTVISNNVSFRKKIIRIFKITEI